MRDLVSAIFEQDLNLVKSILDKGVMPKELNPGPQGPLWVATFTAENSAKDPQKFQNQVEIFKLILAKVNNLNDCQVPTKNPTLLDLFREHGLDLYKKLPCSDTTYLKYLLVPSIPEPGYKPDVELLKYLHATGVDISVFKFSDEENFLQYLEREVSEANNVTDGTDVGNTIFNNSDDSLVKLELSTGDHSHQ